MVGFLPIASQTEMRHQGKITKWRDEQGFGLMSDKLQLVETSRQAEGSSD
jgi:hypothetical protein